MTKYPMHDKLEQIEYESQKSSEFLEWVLSEKGYSLCTWSAEVEAWEPVRKSIEQLLAEYFEIDLEKIEKEKREMLEEFRKG